MIDLIVINDSQHNENHDNYAQYNGTQHKALSIMNLADIEH